MLGNHGSNKISYDEFTNKVKAGQVVNADIDTTNGHISGKLTDKSSYTVTGPNPASPQSDDEEKLLASKGVKISYHTPSSNALLNLLPILLLFGAAIGLWIWMGRRAQGQMSGIMSIGRSKAKVYTTERPQTTFADVAGYQGVKMEIREVVDFLKSPGRFRDIGAKIPKGVLLVGPPGTGKTLIARAVAGEAGVPFVSVTGSDFMEMFVGVGASRVRDLFQTARKQSPAIIFVDEIDSIGRKRGAGLGGGHDEREQTLNQMLAEMDGFETTEGVVILAATNRPDILDPALLRPGRFDRQIVVPLPDLEERRPILEVHCKDKRIGPDVDLEVLARGTPGMSGADLANLVNEAALHAVRRNSESVHMQDFEAARDRVLMGQRRESMALSEQEKERVAFHEGGHAVLAYLLTHADPVHKVTILPTGMALGVTQQLPMEERHIYPREYIEDSLAVRMGGRCAELLVYGDLSTGANNDLVGNTELARKMVREWGMSDRIGPMAWGSQGAVFLGDDLMHSRDYSDETSRVIDEEVERILREQEDRALEVLTRHRLGLNAVAGALLEKETIDGAEVGRLVTTGDGGPGPGPAANDRVGAPVSTPASVVPPYPDASAPRPPLGTGVVAPASPAVGGRLVTPSPADVDGGAKVARTTSADRAREGSLPPAKPLRRKAPATPTQPSARPDDTTWYQPVQDAPPPDPEPTIEFRPRPPGS
jgi:cell division protease FtsH